MHQLDWCWFCMGLCLCTPIYIWIVDWNAFAAQTVCVCAAAAAATVVVVFVDITVFRFCVDSLGFHERLFTNRQYCESKPELHTSTVIPRSCTYRVSKHTFDLICFNRPPSRNSHRWFSLSSHIRIMTMDPLAYVTSVKHKSWCLIWPFFVIVHSWLPPVSWHW